MSLFRREVPHASSTVTALPSTVERSPLHSHGPAPTALLGDGTRSRVAFLALALGLMLFTLVLYQPSQQEGLLCGSNQAQRARTAYAVEPRTMDELRRIQHSTNAEAKLPYIYHSTDAPSTIDNTDESSSVVGLPKDSPYLPLPPPRAPYRWERKTFTAPPITGPDAPPPARTRAELRDGGHFRRWESQWKAHFDARGGNHMVAFHDWLAPAVDKLVVRAAPLHQVDQAVVMLDGRRDPMVIFILKHTFHMLGPGWGLVIFHTEGNEKWFIEQLRIHPGEPGEHIQLQRVEPISKGQANSLAMSTVFYERIGVETVLLLQPDGFMLRSPWLGTQEDRETWDNLLSKYVYIGAPWGWCHEEGSWCKYGGNGGVSLRKASVMRDVTSELRCTEWECHRHDLFRDQEYNPDAWWRTEDTYVAKVLHQHQHRWKGRLPNQRESAEFSLEHLEVPEANPFFCHKVWLYQPPARWMHLLAHVRQYYPELDQH